MNDHFIAWQAIVTALDRNFPDWCNNTELSPAKNAVNKIDQLGAKGKQMNTYIVEIEFTNGKTKTIKIDPDVEVNEELLHSVVKTVPQLEFFYGFDLLTNTHFSVMRRNVNMIWVKGNNDDPK
jgi:hypothetical protein